MSNEFRIETVRGDLLERWQINGIRRLDYELYLENESRVEKIVPESGKKIRFSTFQKKHLSSSYSRKDRFYTILIPDNNGYREKTVWGTILGFFDENFNCNWISSFFIVPEYRGRGFGKRMLAAALKDLESRHPVHCELNVIATNSNAIGLYRKFGFCAPVVYTLTNKAKPGDILKADVAG